MVLTEERLKLALAAKIAGVHVATCHRWRLRGVRGVKLRTCVIGCQRYTTRAWLEEFVAATTAAADAASVPELSLRRQRELDAVERRLVAADGRSRHFAAEQVEAAKQVGSGNEKRPP